MVKLAFLLFVTSLLISMLLSGCNIRPPFVVFVGADNNNHTSESRSAVCTGGIKTRLSVQGRTVETPLAPPGDGRTVEFMMPEDAPAGTIMATEAWCYDADNAELAYVRVSRPYVDTSILGVTALAPFLPPVEKSLCQPATETRGPNICIVSSMYGSRE